MSYNIRGIRKKSLLLRNKSILICFLMVIFFMINCTNTPKELHFTVPKLINTQNLDSTLVKDTTKLFRGELPLFMGLYSFIEERIDLNPSRNGVDTGRYNSRIVDVMPNNQEQIQRLDKQIKESVFDVYAYYDRELEYITEGEKFTMYPIYLVNSSDKEFIFHGHSAYTTVNEMYWDEKKEKWISFQSLGSIGLSFCGGYSYFIKIHPKEYVLLLAPKHKSGQVFNMKIDYRDGARESTIYQGLIDTSLYEMYLKSDSSEYLRLK